MQPPEQLHPFDVGHPSIGVSGPGDAVAPSRFHQVMTVVTQPSTAKSSSANRAAAASYARREGIHIRRPACDRPRLLQKPAMKRALRIAEEVVKGL